MAGAPKSLSPDQLAAHALLSELRTRIATQPLPYQHGLEASALESLRDIFQHARAAMKNHPGCKVFAQLTTDVLNVDLRPFTAKWHRAYASGVLNSRDGANAFRLELKAVQTKLLEFSKKLQELAYGSYKPDAIPPAVLKPKDLDELFSEIQFGAGTSATKNQLLAETVKDIDAAEAEAIRRRRDNYGISKRDGFDAVGLALSGGGIRSATFCLGVLQVIADRGLFKEIDYMSTVSGGGYTGCLITSALGGSSKIEDIASPYGPDTEVIRHVRQNAKYLSSTNLKQRWLVVAGTLAGLLLNWTAPLCIISALAWICGWLDPNRNISFLSAAISWSLVATVVAMLVYGVTRKYPPLSRYGDFVLSLTTIVVAIALILLVIEDGYLAFMNTSLSSWSISGTLVGALISLPAVIRFVPFVSQKKARDYIFKGALLLAGLAVPVFFVGVFYFFREYGAITPNPDADFWGPFHLVSGRWALGILFAITAVFAVFPLNINLTGPHKLYRDRLSNTFVVPKFGISTPLVQEINSSNRAPYHLINAAVNLPSSTSPTLRERRSDFFLISKYWTGSPALGYSKTGEWKSDGINFDLATAMAISGAAASPHMGLASLPSLSALMTLLNIRLGYWITRPKTSTGAHEFRRLLKKITGLGMSETPGFWCLLKEMTGLGMSERSNWLNLSDGGHIENMGIYELLRRRCKFIVCIDGEADLQSTFQGQLTLVRHAQIDFGIRIEPHLADLRQDQKSQLSRTHFHLFKVHYPGDGEKRPDETGLMLYLKLSMTGDEPELLRRYRTLNAEFPHQSTLDQFFDEEQFEVYRQLGVHVAEGTFSPALMGSKDDPSTISVWFRKLAECLLEP